MKKSIVVALLAGAAILGSGTAQAARVDWSVTIGAPVAAGYPVAYPAEPVPYPSVAYPAYSAGYPAAGYPGGYSAGYPVVRPVQPPVVYAPAARLVIGSPYYAPYPVYARPWPVVYPRYYRHGHDGDDDRGGWRRGWRDGGDRDHDHDRGGRH